MMMKRFAMLVAILLTTIFNPLNFADDSNPNAWLDAVVKTCKESARTKRVQLDSQLAYLKKLKGKGTYKSLVDKSRAITAVESQIRNPDGELFSFDEISVEKTDVGSVGYAYGKELNVVQVLDAKASLVEIFRYRPSAAVNAAGKLYKDAKLIFLEADTSKWTDDSKVEFNLPIAIVGTKQYRTANGSNTVLHAKALDAELIHQIRTRVTFGDKEKSREPTK